MIKKLTFKAKLVLFMPAFDDETTVTKLNEFERQTKLLVTAVMPIRDKDVQMIYLTGSEWNIFRYLRNAMKSNNYRFGVCEGLACICPKEICAD